MDILGVILGVIKLSDRRIIHNNSGYLSVSCVRRHLGVIKLSDRRIIVNFVNFI